MKQVLAPLILLATWCHADVVIEQKMESPFMSGNMVMKIKGDQSRTDMPASAAGEVSVIMNLKSGEMATLVHGQKMTMKMNLDAAKKQAENAQKATGIDTSKLEKPKATGKTEKVGEWDTEIYEATIGTMPAKFWVAKDFPNYKAISEQMNKFSAAMGNAGFDPSKFDLGGMVVKSEMTMPNGKMTSTVVKAKEEPIEASVFTLPADYKEIPFPGQ
jgi:hypothetical protein